MTTQYIYDLVDTWNNGATTFTAIKMNVTDTASGAVSNLLDIGTGGGTYVSKFKVRKDGEAQAVSFNQSGSGGNFLQGGVYISSNNAILAFGGSSDTILSWRAAANLRLGAADAAGSAIAVSSVATNQLTLASSHGLTSGAAVIITGTTAPSGTSLNTLYYARSISAAVIELYLTFDTATATSGTTGIVAVTTAGTSASIRLATPFQRLSPQDFTGTDIPGQPLLINGSRGTGTGPGGSIVFQVAPAGSTGATQNALATAFQVNGSGGITGQDGAAANTLALRNGANAQTFRVYNTTDGTNSEFGSIKWNSNVLEIAADIAGSGTRRPLAMVAGVAPYTVLKTTDYGIYLRQIATSSGLNLYNSDANALAAGSTGRVAYLEGGTGICLSSSFEIKFSSGADAASSHDSGIARSGTGVLRLTNASTGGGALQLTEMTAPAAPGANNVRIYAEDNGSGKTRIMALFPTGAAVQIAIEP